MSLYKDKNLKIKIRSNSVRMMDRGWRMSWELISPTFFNEVYKYVLLKLHKNVGFRPRKINSKYWRIVIIVD